MVQLATWLLCLHEMGAWLCSYRVVIIWSSRSLCSAEPSNHMCCPKGLVRLLAVVPAAANFGAATAAQVWADLYSVRSEQKRTVEPESRTKWPVRRMFEHPKS